MNNEGGSLIKSEGNYFNQVLEGVPSNIRSQVEEAILLYSREKEGKDTLTDEIKSEKLRQAFNALFNFLIENLLNQLNVCQELFINTGALADIVEIKDKDREKTTIQLLNTEVYKELLKITQESKKLPFWTDNILTVMDKFKAISQGEIPPLDLLRPAAKSKVLQQVESKEIQEGLKRKGDAILKECQENIKRFEHLFQQFQLYIKYDRLRENKRDIDAVKDFLKDLNSQNKFTELETSLGEKMAKACLSVSRFTTDAKNILTQIEKIAEELSKKIFQYMEVRSQISKGEAEIKKRSYRETYVFFDEEKIKLIKKDVGAITPFLVRGAESSPERIPFSASRILLSKHTENVDNPVKEAYCTVQNVMLALEKISRIHINLFPKDSQGFPITPPIIIEPVRNYVEWFEDRIIMSYVSGEGYRKGPRFTFTPVDMQVLKACGLYLTKDPIYNYRGEPNLGTFMGDYAGKIEKKAMVKWLGEKKERTIVSATQISDEAGREEAVRDYMEFIFNLANGFPPPPRLSQRKINILLKYVLIESLENTIKLIIKFIVNRDPYEAREIILKHANRSSKEARRLIEVAFRDSQIAKFYRGDIELLMTKIFGKDY